MLTHQDLLKLADLAYTNPFGFHHVGNWHQKLHIQYDEQSGVALFTVNGTDQPADWLTNLYAQPIGGWHGGFYQAAEDLFTRLRDDHSDILEQAVVAQGSGDSMGGAVAVIVAQRWNRWRGACVVQDVVTSGCPAHRVVGSAAHLDQYLIPAITHYEYGCDIIPDLLQGLGYEHLGQRKRFNKRRRWSIWPFRRWMARAITDHTNRKQLIRQVTL